MSRVFHKLCKGKRNADPQSASVYLAEDSICKSQPVYKLARHAQWFLDEICVSQFYRNKTVLWRHVRIQEPKNARIKCCYAHVSEGLMTVPLTRMSPLVLIHELSHFCVPISAPDHGKQFCGVYLALTRMFLGEYTYHQLKSAFDQQEVDYEILKIGASGGSRTLNN